MVTVAWAQQPTVSMRARLPPQQIATSSDGPKQLLVTGAANGAVRPPGYYPPPDYGFGVPPPTAAGPHPGGMPDGSDNDIGYCHAGYCIEGSQGTYRDGWAIRFDIDLVKHRNDPNLHQVLARAFHPHYVPVEENFSANDCIGGWRTCNPPAVYDVAVRKIASCDGMPPGCIPGAWTFQFLHSYLWANQVSTLEDHCGDAEGNIVVVRVDPNDPHVAHVWYVKARDDKDAVDAGDLDFTGAHPQFTNHRDHCGFVGCMGSHHKQYARRTSDRDAHGGNIDGTVTFFHPGLPYAYKRAVDPWLSCVMPSHGFRCGDGSSDEGHDNDDARCNRPPYQATLRRETNAAGAAGPWGAAKSGTGAFYGGYLDHCPLTSRSESGWGIGRNASWTFGDPGATSGHPRGVRDDTTAWYPCGNAICDTGYGESPATCPQDCTSGQ